MTAGGRGVPVEGTEIEPDFLGSLGPDTVFFGFSKLDPEDVHGNRPGALPATSS